MKIGKFVKQYKGKDLSKVPKSKLLTSGWWYGLKYDGQYIQLHKSGSKIWMFTSKGEPMYIKEIAEELLKMNHDFIVEAEFNNNSDGTKLNDRRLSSTGTARADFKKGIVTSYPNCKVKVFDILNWEGFDANAIPFKIRRHHLLAFHCIPQGRFIIDMVKWRFVNSLESAINESRVDISNGSEGGFAFNENHTIKANVNTERSNLAIKLKANKTAKMICVGAKESDTVDGEWGALELQDENSNIQYFGGLPDRIRKMYPNIPTKQIFTVKYESFTKGKYVQGFIYDDRM